VDGLVRAVALAGREDDRFPPGEWRALVALAVGEAALPPPPEPAAGAVELWALEDAPALSARAAVLAGCARGAWPPAPEPDPLLRDAERRAVNDTLRRAALPTSATRRADAAFRAFCAAAAGREVVAFTWAAPGPAGDGAPLAPIVSDALAVLGVPVPAAPAADPPLARARTAREALRAVARGGPAAARALAGTPLAPRAASVVARGGLERARRAAVRARRAAPHAGAPGQRGLAALRAALPSEWSPTQLERYARCPFRLFLDVGAGLEEPGTDGLDIDVRDEGSLLHAILEAFVRARVERGAWPPAGSDADRAEARAIAVDVLGRFEREGRTGDPAVWAARRDAVLARLERVVAAEARDADGLVPALLEHAFGGRSGRPPLEVSAGGATVRLRGRIDRVDAGPDRLVVLDYKNAKASRGAAYAELLDPEAFGRTSFQIPAYLLAAARELPGRPRLLATYALLRSAERLDPVELRAGDGAEAAFAEGVADVVARIERGDFAIASRSCERCPFGAVCRFEGVAAAGAEEDAA
jgi:RecB family exonuclease